MMEWDLGGGRETGNLFGVALTGRGKAGLLWYLLASALLGAMLSVKEAKMWHLRQALQCLTVLQYVK